MNRRRLGHVELVRVHVAGHANEALDGAAVLRLVDLGMVERGNGRLRTTRAGRPLLNAILRDLAA